MLTSEQVVSCPARRPLPSQLMFIYCASSSHTHPHLSRAAEQSEVNISASARSEFSCNEDVISSFPFNASYLQDEVILASCAFGVRAHRDPAVTPALSPGSPSGALDPPGAPQGSLRGTGPLAERGIMCFHSVFIHK
ncbi:unnamed protein product [Pleuronectes platessa]|uniref:Uncharacterized protein n=1 Tax=Pleuronectes platessa TaxID=8262 RepID=A0A9N7ZBI3_PLEPL|nr:unnamed protein product [Pleuronectes platessa]